jgi:geranylgeranyl reductase family protein
VSQVEVLVVGAGAAGAATAAQLARRGRSVLLCDAASPGQVKSCGGGMAASVQRWFPFDLSPCVEQVIQRVRFSWCLEDPVIAELPGTANFWIVRRAQFDAFLAQQAEAAGARLLQPCAIASIEPSGQGWEVRDREGRLHLARAVVIADGSGSRFAAPLGLGPPRPRFASTLSVECETAVAEPDQARFDFGLVHHGFCWGFPRRDGWSIGVGTFIGQEEADTDAVLAALLPSLAIDPAATQRRQGRLRLWSGHFPLHGEGLVAVGDAASLCDPFLAEGLRPALLSATRAAAALDRWLSGERGALADYSLTMRREWGDSMAWGKRIAQVFYRLPKVGYQLGVKRPTAPQRIAEILSGEVGYGDIAQRVIKRLMFQRG